MNRITFESSQLQQRFVRSTYVTLAMASLALTYSEWDVLPEISLFAAACAFLFLIAYLLEGRWSLSLTQANLVGAAIGLVAGVWAAFQIVRPTSGLLRSIPWPASMLPFLGPLLLILIPAKLFRPKRIADYWGLHFIALTCVALGCILTDDALFALLLILYLFCAMRSLALFLLFRNLDVALPSIDTTAQLPHRSQLVSWAVPVTIVAAIGFFATPRSGNTWQLNTEKGRTETGIQDESAIDLNRSGRLELNRDVAFEVYAEDVSGSPKLDLDTFMRWRGQSFRYYYNGRWTNRRNSQIGEITGRSAGLAPISSNTTPSGTSYNMTLPDLGPGQFFLTYQLIEPLRFPFLAAPIVYPATGTAAPVIQIGRPTKLSPAFFRTVDGGLQPFDPFNSGGRRYKQVTRPVPDQTVSSPISQIERVLDPSLIEIPNIPAIPKWTLALLQRLIDQKKLSPEIFVDRDADGNFDPRHYEKIARSLERFFTESHEFKYSLELQRTDEGMDPMEDFLFHTKIGPCTRFASALAVMLRSIRIPCLMVQGFRGADSRGDGHYDVRQCHAHAWVEVVVPRPKPHPLMVGSLAWYWLTLDPTPAEESLEAAADANIWWNRTDWTTGRLFKDLIVNYSPERRDRAMQLFKEAASEVWAAFVRRVNAPGIEGFRARLAVFTGFTIAALAFGLLLQRLVRRGKKTGPSVQKAMEATAFYRRLLAALARRGWKPASGETPLEFAASLAPKLPDDSSRSLVDRVTALFYRVRFGDLPLGPEEKRQIDDGLIDLTARLSAN